MPPAPWPLRWCGCNGVLRSALSSAGWSCGAHGGHYGSSGNNPYLYRSPSLPASCPTGVSWDTCHRKRCIWSPWLCFWGNPNQDWGVGAHADMVSSWGWGIDDFPVQRKRPRREGRVTWRPDTGGWGTGRVLARTTWVTEGLERSGLWASNAKLPRRSHDRVWDMKHRGRPSLNSSTLTLFPFH